MPCSQKGAWQRAWQITKRIFPSPAHFMLSRKSLKPCGLSPDSAQISQLAPSKPGPLQPSWFLGRCLCFFLCCICTCIWQSNFLNFLNLVSSNAILLNFVRVTWLDACHDLLDACHDVHVPVGFWWCLSLVTLHMLRPACTVQVNGKWCYTYVLHLYSAFIQSTLQYCRHTLVWWRCQRQCNSQLIGSSYGKVSCSATPRQLGRARDRTSNLPVAIQPFNLLSHRHPQWIRNVYVLSMQCKLLTK